LLYTEIKKYRTKRLIKNHFLLRSAIDFFDINNNVLKNSYKYSTNLV